MALGRRLTQIVATLALASVPALLVTMLVVSAPGLAMLGVQTQEQLAINAVHLLAWVATCLVATWLIVTNLAFLAVSCGSRSPVARNLEGRVGTLRRRLFDQAMTLSVVAVSVAGPVSPAVAQTSWPPIPLPPTTSETPVDVDDPPGDELPALDVVDTPSVAASPAIPAPVEPPPSQIPEDVDTAQTAERGDLTDPGPVLVTALPGDHLWKLSAERVDAHLRAAEDRPAEIADIDAYWRRVITANADRLASGNPDVVEIGETVVLPALVSSPEADVLRRRHTPTFGARP